MKKGNRRIALLLVLTMMLSFITTTFGIELPATVTLQQTTGYAQQQVTTGPGLTVEPEDDQTLKVTTASALQLGEMKQAFVTVERATLGQSYLIEPTIMTFYEGENVAEALVRVLGEGNYESTGRVEDGFYLSQIKLLDSLEMNIPECIYEFAESGGCGRDDFEENDDDWLGEFDHSMFSGWIYWVNHIHMPVGMSGATLQAGDVVRLQFTVYGYGSDLGLGDASWGFGTPNYTVANKDNLIRSLAYINADKSALESNPVLKEAYNQANEIMCNLTSSQDEVDNAVKALEAAKNFKPADKTKLQETLQKAQNIDRDEYTNGTKKVLDKAIKNAITVNEDALVTQEMVDECLAQLKQALDGLKIRETYEAFLTVERNTLGQPYLLEPTVVTFREDENVAQVIARTLGKENISYGGSLTQSFYLRAIKLKDQLPLNVPEALLQDAGLKPGDIKPNTDNWLGEFDHYGMSGWMYWVNHVSANFGMADWILKPNEVIRLQFTLYGYGSDLGGESWGPTASYEAANKDALIRELASINKELSILETNPVLKEAYEKAIIVGSDLVAKQDEVDKALEALQEGKDFIPADKTTLEAAMEKVKALNEALYTEESWAELEVCVEHAKNILNNPIVTQEEVDACVQTIEAAIDALENKEVEHKDYKVALEDTLQSMYVNTPEPTLGTFGGEWTMLSLARGGYPYSDDYAAGYVKRVEDIMTEKEGILHKRKYTEYSRLALGFTAIGEDITDVAGYSLLTYLADFDKVIWQGINGPTFALIALDSHNYEIPEAPEGAVRTTREKLIEDILKQEIKGGGFALTGSKPDVDVTAMVLQALAPYQDKPEVNAATDRALNILSSVQTATGGFENAYGGASGGNAATSESTSQVIVALCALGIDPTGDERFIKNGYTAIDDLLTYYVEGEGFKHLHESSVDAMATDQAAYALVAYDRFITGQNSLYDMTDVIIGDIDKTILKAKLESIAQLEEGRYTKATWEVLKEAQNQAIRIYQSTRVTQEAVDEAVKRLDEAVAQLVLRTEVDLDIVDGVVEVPEQDDNMNYQVNLNQGVGSVHIIIPVNNMNRLSLNLEEGNILPEVQVTKGDVAVHFNKGIQVEGATKFDILTSKTDEEKTAIQKLIEKLKENEKAEVTLYSAYGFGNGNQVRLSDYATVTFKGLAGKASGYIDGTGTFCPITQRKNRNIRGQLDTYSYDEGEDLVVKSKILADLVVYTAEEQGTDIPTPPTGQDTITLSIDKLTINKGYVIAPTEVPFYEGENVWDVLKREMDQRGIAYEYEWTPKYGSVYVQSIDGDGEFDHGRWSGWMYNVNEWYPNYGASKYILKDGDVVQWRYTTNLGDDLGVDNSEWETYPDGTPKNPNGGYAPGSIIDRGYPDKKYADTVGKDYTILEGVKVAKDALNEVSYKDVDEISDWAQNAVKVGTVLGMVEGDGGYFRPQQAMTRAEFTKVLMETLGYELDYGYNNTFEDVSQEAWYTPYVYTAYQLGIVEGYGKVFKPAQTLSRQEMAIMLMRALKLETDTQNTRSVLKDEEDVASWAKNAVAVIYEQGFMTGRDQTFYPCAEVTREMATVAFVRVYSSNHPIEEKHVPEAVGKALDETTNYMLKMVSEPTIGSIGGEWAVFGLARRGVTVPKDYYDTYYKKVIDHVQTEVSKTDRAWKTKITETQRIAIAVAAIGKDPSNVDGIDLVDYSWNKEKNMAELDENDRILGNRQGLNELVFGLIAMDLKGSKQPGDATVSRDSIMERMFALYRTEDGGFNLREHEKVADVDMTAMTLQALAPYYKVEGYEYVTKVVDEALNTLSKKQCSDGGFENAFGGADGGNAATSESTAQVIVALCSLGIDPHTDSRFVKNGRSSIDDLMSYAVAGGGFRHLHEGGVDQMATEQAYYALVAYERFVNGESPIYYMKNVVEAK